MVCCVASPWVDLILSANNSEALVVMAVGAWELFFDCIKLCLAVLSAFNERVRPVEVS